MSEALPKVEDSEESQDSSEMPTQLKKSLKYKDSHLKDLIIGNKDVPLRTRSTFRDDNRMLGYTYLIEPTSVDEDLSYNGWIMSI